MTYTLVADGASDSVLLPILTWSLKQNSVTPILAQRADLTRIPKRSTAEQRLEAVLDLFPCDLLFVHRDAEGQPAVQRREEIADLLRRVAIPHVPVVPIRMTEAWLLVDEMAIRSAAGNPNGTVPLDLPSLRKLEQVPDPKKVLLGALTTASGLNVRRRSRLAVHERVHRISDYIADYSALMVLSAFQVLQRDIRQAVERLGN